MYLPAEIIKQVGEYLTLTEQGSCIRVCYAWYGPFLDLLYTKVHIRSRNQFRLFYSTIQASRQIEDPLGDHVKELTFAYDTGTHKEPHAVGITRDELESFPDLFRHLQVLDFEPKLWKYMRYSDKLSNMKQLKRLPTITKQSLFQPIIDNLASQLTYLSLGGESLGYILNNNLTTSIWTRMPKLERLEIQGNNHVNLNVKMLMALGAQLPRLKHLVLGCVTLPLDEHDMGSTTTFPLFTSAVSLTLKDVHLKNWKMITFLSLAFYHVEVLDFDVTFDWFYNENVTIELYEQSMDACMGFAQLCIFLKKIIFRKISTSVFPFPYDAFFQEIADIHSNNVKVEMTDYAWWSTIDPVSSFKSVTVQTGLLSKADLKWSWTGKKTDVSLFRNFKLCKHLTELKLDCDIQLKNGVRLDLLLENVEQLEKLHLSNVLVTTSKNYEKSKKYRLQLLDLNQAVLGNHLMDYISQFCTSLQDLWISNSVQEKPRRSAFIVIRMPDHRFKTIKLNSLHLNPGGSRGKSEVPISLLSFYESTRYNRQIERKKETAPEMWRFYHIHKTPHVKKQLRRLSTKEAAVIANFEMNEKKWKIVKNSSARKSFQDEKLWEKDIQFGAILLLCKSVDNFEFNELQL
ncbi:hypothetical protein MFLAVUS_011240 [Mucor flavus]|uniref:F-box domain-containing protein n=1 Tax=Mucor flavus TaxID=439312 RepID=A0ABP9ZF62_9FUNG